MTRSLNKVELIGNLTRDPELRYTPSGTAVCTIGLATNRAWNTETGEKKEEVEYHRLVAWNKLAELCSQLLSKGRKIYVEGRLQTRKWSGQDGNERTTTEIVINDMIILDPKGSTGSDDFNIPDDPSFDDVPADGADSGTKAKSSSKPAASKNDAATKSKSAAGTDDTDPAADEDIPF